VQRGFNYTILVAARPDTEFASAVPISMPPRGTVFVPSFAHGTWATGVNDRFAYGRPLIVRVRVRVRGWGWG
jgi:hypothetical protein